MGQRPDWTSDFPYRDWFSVVELGPGTHLISEPVHVNSYLIEGSERAVLLDTGLGLADIRKVAEGLSGKPLRVVNSHYHFDHSGGNRWFPEIAIHRSGAELLATPPPEDLAAAYMEYVHRLHADWVTYRELDDRYFRLLTGEVYVRPLPEGFADGDFEILPSRATTLLDDGDVIDLGDRRLRVLHTPGHSPDSICLFEERTGMLFTGDTLSAGAIYAHAEDADVGSFARSTARLAGMAADVRRVFVCHFLRYESPASFLRAVGEGFERVLAGEAPLRPSIDFLGAPVVEACFDAFSIFLPAGWDPAAGGDRVPG